jgi:hypothetical protein
VVAVDGRVLAATLCIENGSYMIGPIEFMREKQLYIERLRAWLLIGDLAALCSFLCRENGGALQK